MGRGHVGTSGAGYAINRLRVRSGELRNANHGKQIHNLRLTVGWCTLSASYYPAFLKILFAAIANL